jgi:hypothetical protein
VPPASQPGLTFFQDLIDDGLFHSVKPVVGKNVIG